MSGFVATTNIPGYLPMDDDPPVFETAREGWAWLAEERKRGEDHAFETAEPGEDDGYSATVNTLESVGNGILDYADAGLDPDTGQGVVYASTPGYDGEHDLGLAYCVTYSEEASTDE